VVDFLDQGCEGVTDTGNFLQPAGFDKGFKFTAVIFQHPPAPLISSRLKRILAFDFQKTGDFPQISGNVEPFSHKKKLSDPATDRIGFKNGAPLRNQLGALRKSYKKS
jgi:hypothetical protein